MLQTVHREHYVSVFFFVCYIASGFQFWQQFRGIINHPPTGVIIKIQVRIWIATGIASKVHSTLVPQHSHCRVENKEELGQLVDSNHSDGRFIGSDCIGYCTSVVSTKIDSPAFNAIIGGHALCYNYKVL